MILKAVRITTHLINSAPGSKGKSRRSLGNYPKDHTVIQEKNAYRFEDLAHVGKGVAKVGDEFSVGDIKYRIEKQGN